MRAVDTNVLLRIVTRDDEKQVEIADAYIEDGTWVSHLALVETLWVLSTGYRLDPDELADAVEMLLRHRSLTLQDADVVLAALEQYRLTPSLGFSDCMLLEIARKAGHLPLGTFDRKLSRLEGTERL
jgi:predicted nucleic-acid-binding protein